MIGALTVCLSVSASGQQARSCSIEYRNKNMVDYGPLKVKTIDAKASDPTGALMSEVCVGLFTEKDHTLVATALSDDNGDVEIKQIKSGDYRLVAVSPGFVVLNAKLRITRRGAKKLLLHMVLGQIDSASYATLQ